MVLLAIPIRRIIISFCLRFTFIRGGRCRCDSDTQNGLRGGGGGVEIGMKGISGYTVT